MSFLIMRHSGKCQREVPVMSDGACGGGGRVGAPWP